MRVFGDEDEAAGFAIEAIDDREARAVGDVVGEQVVQAIEQCGWAIGLGGVDLEGGWFVDDDPVVGFGDDAKVRAKGNGTPRWHAMVMPQPQLASSRGRR